MNKRLLIFVVWLFAVINLPAQVTQKGNFVVGSALGFATAKSNVSQDGGEEESPVSTQLNIAPVIGYFLIDELAVGLRMDYTFNKVEDPNTSDRRDSDLLFGPFARYYFPVGEDMAFLLEAGFGFGNANDEQAIGERTQKINTNIFAFGVGPGFTIISNEAIGLQALVKYNFARSDFDTEIGGVKRETVTKTNQLELSIGIQFYFSGVSKSEAGSFY